MKRFFSFFMVMVSMFVFTNCDRHNSETVVKDVETVDYVYRIEYDGHKYIVFKHNGNINHNNVSGVVHDPDCKCS